MKKTVVVAAAALLSSFATLPAHAQASDPFLGQLAWVPYNFAPRGWHFCDGSVVLISDNSALFALLGTTYGGDGVTTFNLPDLRGRVMVSSGQGPGLSNRTIGEVAGEEAVTLTASQMPAHTHALVGTTQKGNQIEPTDNLLARPQVRDGDAGLVDSTTLPYRKQALPTAVMAPNAIGSAGGNQPHDNMPPYTVLNCIIAINGVFPSRP